MRDVRCIHTNTGSGEKTQLKYHSPALEVIYNRPVSISLGVEMNGQGARQGIEQLVPLFQKLLRSLCGNAV